MKPTTKEERLRRIIARGEHSGHDHIVVGDVEVIQQDDRTIIVVGEDSNAALKHLLEKPWLENGEEVWTNEHNDIPLPAGRYTFTRQFEYDAFRDAHVVVAD